MTQIELSVQEKKDLLSKLIKENSVGLANDILGYLDTVNKKYAKYEFSTEFDSNLNFYVSEIISRNFAKFNETGEYTNLLGNYNLTSNDIEYYINKIKAIAATRVISKIYFEKRDFI
jgi:hypothetical protein